MRGGKRRGAGRRPGSVSKEVKEGREVLAASKGKLISKAVQLATGPKPNIHVLCKLLDKVLPSLSVHDVSGVHIPPMITVIHDNIPLRVSAAIEKKE